jgi:hypothetical protein
MSRTNKARKNPFLENPFPESDPRHVLWEPSWEEARDSLRVRIQRRARLNEDAAEALHTYLKAPTEERAHLWEASTVRWLRTLKPDIEWPDTAPTSEEAGSLLLQATADDPRAAVKTRLDKLAADALEKFIKTPEQVGLYKQILPRIKMLVLAAFRQELAAILGRKVSRGTISSADAAEQRERDLLQIEHSLSDWEHGWEVIRVQNLPPLHQGPQPRPPAMRSTSESGSAVCSSPLTAIGGERNCMSSAHPCRPAAGPRPRPRLPLCRRIRAQSAEQGPSRTLKRVMLPE